MFVIVRQHHQTASHSLRLSQSTNYKTAQMRRFSFLRAQWCASKLEKIGLCLFFIHKQRLSLSLIFVYTFCSLSPLSSSLKAPFNETAHFYTSIFSALPNNPIKYKSALITLPIEIADRYAATHKRGSIAAVGLPSRVHFTVKISAETKEITLELYDPYYWIVDDYTLVIEAPNETK